MGRRRAARNERPGRDSGATRRRHAAIAGRRGNDAHRHCAGSRAVAEACAHRRDGSAAGECRSEPFAHWRQRNRARAADEFRRPTVRPHSSAQRFISGGAVSSRHARAIVRRHGALRSRRPSRVKPQRQRSMHPVRPRQHLHRPQMRGQPRRGFARIAVKMHGAAPARAPLGTLASAHADAAATTTCPNDRPPARPQRPRPSRDASAPAHAVTALLEPAAARLSGRRYRPTICSANWAERLEQAAEELGIEIGD